MADSPDDAEARLAAVYAALAESVLTESPEELRAEERAFGEDPDALAAHVGDLFDAALRADEGRARRAAAMEEHARQVAVLHAQRADLPATPAARRALLDAVLADPALGTAVTLQFRHFRALTDDDVTSLLHQLHALGVPLPRGAAGDR